MQCFPSNEWNIDDESYTFHKKYGFFGNFLVIAIWVILRAIKGEPANHNVSAPMKRATASSTASPTSLLVKLTGLIVFGAF